MITKDGQCEGKGELTGKEVAEIIRQAQEGLLEKITAAVAGSGRSWGRAGCDGQTTQSLREDTSASLADIARAMAKSSEVEGTNFDSLGKEQRVEGESQDGDRTIDMIGDIP